MGISKDELAKVQQAKEEQGYRVKFEKLEAEVTAQLKASGTAEVSWLLPESMFPEFEKNFPGFTVEYIRTRTPQVRVY